MENKSSVCEKQMFQNVLKKTLENVPINELSKALATVCFRNGVIEDYHVSYGISDADMKVLNKDVVNRIATILQWWKDGKYVSLYQELNFGLLCSGNWDDPEPVEAMSEVEEEFEELLLNCKKQKLFCFNEEQRCTPLPNKHTFFTLTENEMNDIIVEMTDNEEDVVAIIEDGSIPVIYVEDEEKFHDFNLYNVLEKYYNVYISNIRGVFDDEEETLVWWVEYQ